MQWIALHLPNLPLEALTRAFATPEPRGITENHVIVACDGCAVACGVKPGMTVSAATALAPQLVVRPRNVAAENEALLGLAAWAMQFTPNIAIDLPASLALEVTGSTRLFGSLARIAAHLGEGCAQMGFTIRTAAAPTARSAIWLARSGREVFVADPMQIERTIAGLPVCVAVEDENTLDALAAIGASRIGDVLALPRPEFARRFGQTLLDDLDRALGRVPDPCAFFTPPATFHARLELPAEVTQTEALLFAVKRLFVQLDGFLAARAGGVRRFVLKLTHRDSEPTSVSIGLVAPSRNASHFTVLARERLTPLALPAPVRAISLEADDIAPLVGEDLTLFPGGSCPTEDWWQLVERLRARLGTGMVHGVALAAEHRPEYASQGCELTANGKAAPTATVSSAPRPFWLLADPRPLAEIDAAPHYGGPLRLLAGPERIESGWWDSGDIARDYFVAQTPDCALVWIYRERHAAGGWFLHGLFA